MNNSRFLKKELLFLITISLALGFRQMAMTMVMPFISTYSRTLQYSNGVLAGVALGMFGLMQAIFQIPYGALSDKIGNRKVMLIGIMQVIVGLIMAFTARSIYMLIAARALQGSGAVIATGYSWVTSNVSSNKRPRALSILGMIIGFAAAASFALGPFIHKFLPLKQMFLVCAILMLLVWFIILFFLREDPETYYDEAEENTADIKNSIKKLLKNKRFFTLNLAGFFNNYIMVSVFYIVPIYLEGITGVNGMWKIFMPAVIIAIICMRRSIKLVERGQSPKLIMAAFIVSAIGICFYFNNKSFCFILAGSILFMIGYFVLATVIPSEANDIAENSYRGVANGIINSFQYIGSFIGAIITGAIWGVCKSGALILIIIVAIIGVIIGRSNFKG